MIHRVPIEADTLLVSPFIIILAALSILWFVRSNYLLALSFVIIVSLLNIQFLLSTNFLTSVPGGGRITFQKRLEAVEKVISISNRAPYNITGRGQLSNFPVFTMPYEYMLWWKGHSPITKNVPLKIVIWEKGNEIVVYKQ